MVQEARPRELVIYEDYNGYEPFIDWLENIGDIRTQKRIKMRVRRIGEGNFGDFKHVGEGVLELRMMFGSGYRVYFAEDGDRIILLLNGGDKSSQKKDIQTAIEYWKDYQK